VVRFLLDNDVGHAVASLLRGLGHDVVAATEVTHLDERADVYQRQRGVRRVLIWFPRIRNGANPTLSPTAPPVRRRRDR
jgi:hypothetical protein